CVLESRESLAAFRKQPAKGGSVRERAQVSLLPDGRRLQLHDGPIDLVIEAFGATHEVNAAYQAAVARFVGVLDELCSELSVLRRPARNGGPQPSGVIAKRMAEAVAPYCERTFITPMAAVAGAVAEEILGSMKSAAKLSRAYVNNGGDIALHLRAPGRFFICVVGGAARACLFCQD